LQVLAACETVNVWPAIVSVPVRTAAIVFGATVKLAVPPPEPVAPVTVIHVALLTAVQVQPAVVVTVAEPLSPAAETDWLEGEIENAHPAGPCVTVNVCPPTVSVPLRGVALALAVALNPTVPFPLPLAPLVTVSQDVSLLTPVHAHPAGAVTAVEPAPPSATTDWLVGASA
jgi:hypothetical protein